MPLGIIKVVDFELAYCIISTKIGKKVIRIEEEEKNHTTY